MGKNKIEVVLLGVIALVLVGAVLRMAQSVVLPLIIAWLLSYLLAPVVDFLVRKRMPAWLAVLMVLLLVLGVCYLSGMFIFARIAAFADAYPRYETKLKELVQLLNARIGEENNPLAQIDWFGQVGRFVVRLSGSIVVFASRLLTVIIFLFFMLLGKPFFRYKVRKALSDSDADRATGIMESVTHQIRRYLSVQFMISLVTGILVWSALSLLHVDFAVTWGTLAFFLNFIPTVGSIAASVPPILTALVQYYPRFWPAALALIALLTIQMTIGNVIAPKVMGDKLNLSPVVVLLSLVFWGWLWGIAGALLSVPLAATVKIVCENIEPLRPISVMMGSGKPYQKAADPEHAP